MDKIIRVFLVDDHQVLLEGIRSLLMQAPGIEVAGIAVSANAALEAFQSSQPDVLLTDVQLPGMDGAALTREVKRLYPSVMVCALSMSGDRETIGKLLDAGATGYILKNTGQEELLQAIRTVAQGELYFSDEVSAEMMRALASRKEQPVAPQPVLTSREIEIVRLIAKEYSNTRIAEALFISERTVETHRKNIFRKTGTKSVVGLLKFAMEQNLL